MSQSNQEVTSYFRIVARRWWLILLLPIVTAAVIFALSGTTEPDFKAFTRLQILPVDPLEVSLFSQTRFTASAEQIQAVHDDFYDVIRLPSVAWKTIADLGLSLSAEELIERIDSQHQTDFITVSADMPTPELAQQVVVTQVENALVSYRNIRSKPSEISLAFIESEVETQEQKLGATQEALQQFQLENEISDLDRELVAYQDLRRSLQADRDRAVVEAGRNERLASEYLILSETNRALAEAPITSAIITETLGSEAAVGETEDTGETIDVAEVVDSEPDPSVLAENESLLALSRAQRRSAEDAAATAAGYRNSIVQYDRLLDEKQQQLIYLLGIQERYDLLVSDAARAQATFSFLTDKANEAQLKLRQGQNIGFLQVTDPARLPNVALPKRTAQLLAVGVIVSLLLAIILAFVLEALEQNLGRDQTPAPSTSRRT
ncbi:MAG: hypothetical protein GY759_03390 [Chloroflexi bacterium]|nr:hypothetical protein [Chloroflexota bacterium]